MPISRDQDTIKEEAKAIKRELALAAPAPERQQALRRLQTLLDVSDVSSGRIIGWVASAARRLLPDVLAQLKNARREMQAEVFKTLSDMARACGANLQGFEADASAVFAALLHQPSKASGGSASPAAQCLQVWIRHVHAGSMLPVVFSAAAEDHNRQLRQRALECVVFFLEEWPPELLARHHEAIERVLQDCLQDARLSKLARRGAGLFAERHATGQRGQALEAQGLDGTDEGDGTAARSAEAADAEADWQPAGVQMAVSVAGGSGAARSKPRAGRRSGAAQPRSASVPVAQSPPEKPAAPRVEPENYASMCANRAREAKQRNPKLLARPSSEESARRPGRRSPRQQKQKQKPAIPKAARGRVLGPTLIGIGYTGSEWRSTADDRAARVGAHNASRSRRVSAPGDLPTLAGEEGEKYLSGAEKRAPAKRHGRRRKPTGRGDVGYTPSGPALTPDHPMYRDDGPSELPQGLQTLDRKLLGFNEENGQLEQICADEAALQSSLQSLNVGLAERGYQPTPDPPQWGHGGWGGQGWQQPQPQQQPPPPPQQQQQQQQQYAAQYGQQAGHYEQQQPQHQHHGQHQQSMYAPLPQQAPQHHTTPQQQTWNANYSQQVAEEQQWIAERQREIQQRAPVAYQPPPIPGPAGVYAL